MNKIEFSPYLLRSIFNLLLTDPDFSEEFFPVMDEYHFQYDDEYLFLLAKAYWSLYRKYGVIPDCDTYIEEVFIQKGKNIDLFLHEPIEDDIHNLQDIFIDILEKPIKNKQYIIDNTLRILKLFSIHKVFLKNKNQLANGTVDIDSFVQDIYEASIIADPTSLGCNLFGDLMKRTDDRLANPIILGKVSVGIAGLEDYFEDGGIEPGSLAFWMAASGCGKSNALIYMAVQAALADKLNVLFITAELPETVVKQRFDSCITSTPLWDVRKKAEVVKNLYLKSKQFSEVAKRIHIVEVPMGTTTVKEIEHIYEKLENKDFRADVLIIDYADHLKAAKKVESNRFEIASIYSELKNFALNKKIVIWTASQMNDNGVEESEKKKGTISMRHVAEARAKIHLCDVCIAISRNQDDKDLSSARLTIVKNRLGSGEGAVIRIITDYSCAKFYTGKSEMCNSSDSTVNTILTADTSDL